MTTQTTDNETELEMNVHEEDGHLYIDVGVGCDIFALTREQAAELADKLRQYADTGKL